MRNILPVWLYEKISNDYLKDYLYEIRIRLGKPIAVGYKNNYEKITFRDNYDKRFVIATADLIKYIISLINTIITIKENYHAETEDP